MAVSVFFAWYDLWVGAYIDVKNKTLYVCPLPCVVIKSKGSGVVVVIAGMVVIIVGLGFLLARRKQLALELDGDE